MKITDVVHKFMVLGWWGLAFVMLIFVMSVASTLFLRRKISHHNIQWSQIGLVILSTLLLLISAIWSGWQKFNDLAEADKGQAWIVAAGFVACGLVLSMLLHHQAAIAMRENNDARMLAVCWMIIMSLMWLCISPFQNARFLCAPETIRSEIELSFVKLDSYSKGVIKQYSLYRNRIIPRLIGIEMALDSMVEEQSKEELGGCGPICRKYQYYHDRLQPSVDRLHDEYGLDDPDHDYRQRINEIRTSVNNLLNSSDYSPKAMGSIYYQNASEWVGIVNEIRTMDSPELTLEQAMSSLHQLLDFLRNYKVNPTDNLVRMRAVQRALLTLDPQINDLELAFARRLKKKPSKQSVIYLSAIGRDADFNLASIASIRMNTMLMRKHLRRIWPEALLAFFIDIAGMGFIFIPMFVVFLRGRPTQQALVTIHKTKNNRRKLQTNLKEIEQAAAIVAEKQVNLQHTLKKQLSRLASTKLEREKYLKKMAAQKNEPLLVSRQRLNEQIKKALHRVDQDEKKDLDEATSSTEELAIRGSHEIYRRNVHKRYQGRLDNLAEELKAHEEQVKAQFEKMDIDFIRREETIMEEHARIENKIARQLEAIEKKRQKIKNTLVGERLKLEDAEEWLALSGVSQGTM